MAVPVFVNMQESNSGGAQVQTYAATLPGSLVVGNTLILAAIFYTSGGGPAPTIASGWTTLYTSTGWGLGAYSKLTVFSRRIDGTEGASVVVGNSSVATGYYAGGVLQYSGVASGAVMDGIAQAGAINVGTTTPSPAITTAVADDMVLCFCAGGETLAYTLDTPSNVQRMNPQNTNVAFQVTVREVPKSAIGTLAAGTWTRPSGGQAFLGQTLALLAGASSGGGGGSRAVDRLRRASPNKTTASVAQGFSPSGLPDGNTAPGSPGGALGTGDNADRYAPGIEQV